MESESLGLERQLCVIGCKALGKITLYSESLEIGNINLQNLHKVVNTVPG